MAFNQRMASPAPGQNALRAPSRQDKAPSSSKTSPAFNTFTFPPPLASTKNSSANSQYQSSAYSNTSLNQSTDGNITPSTSTTRFHEAYASIPSSRHRYTDSVASDVHFNLPQDPYEAADRSFDSIARDFGAPSASSQSHGNEVFGDLASAASSRGPSPRFGRVYGYSGPLSSSQPSSLDGDDEGAWDRTLRTGERLNVPEYASIPTVPRAVPLDLVGSTRYDSLETPTGPTAAATENEALSTFLTPPNTDTSSGAAYAGAALGELPRSASRQRSYPAPLLLARDKSRTGPGPPSPVGATFPPPRKLSTSAGSLPASAPAPTFTSARSHNRSAPSSVPAAQSASQQSDGPRTTLAYERHHAKTSSTSSFTQLASPFHATQSSQPFSQSFISPSSSQTLPSLSQSTSSITAPSTSASSTSTAASEPPITPQALLLHVLSLRSASSAPLTLSQSQGPSLRPSTPLEPVSGASHQRIKSAGSTNSDHDGEAQAKASDLGKLDTVDLSHKRIAEVPIEVINELKGEVEKLALGYNMLKELPSQFGMLGNKLRYLNIRVNAFSTLPAVFCDMPSLEILDISRNKIKRLPLSPGTLLHLKVFSIAKNRVKRLPTWFAQMHQLKVLKVDHNPLEWPPKEIATFPLSTGASEGEPQRKVGSKIEEAEEMQKWLPNLLRYIRENAAQENARRDADAKEKSSKDLGDQRRRPSVVSLTTDEERGNTSDFQLPRTSTLARTDSGLTVSTSTSAVAFPRSRPPLSIITDVSVERSRPATATASVDPTARHSRTASHSLMQSVLPEKRPPLRSKKSLPDLRQSHAEILAERRESDAIADDVPEASQNQIEVGTLSLPASEPSQSIPRTSSSRSVSKSPSSRPSSPLQAFKQAMDTTKRAEHDLVAPAALDRNSGAYFRRLSMLPPLTTIKSVPTALLAFADAIRGILFSLSQVYSALRQFVVFASQDRLPAAVARLMGLSDGSLGDLINALDRFDSLSRRGVPNSDIVTSVFVTCRHSVASFMKLVDALRPHLTTLVPSADVRYARTLVLMLFGSIGEIACSWTSLQPIVQDLAMLGQEPSIDNLMVYSPAPSRVESPADSKAQSKTQTPRAPATSKPLMRTRSRSRRHAGSFSVEDVQLGAALPPAPVPEVPPMYAENPTTPTATSFSAAAAASAVSDSPPNANQINTLKARTGKKAPPGKLALPPSTGYRDMVMKAFEHPMTPGATELSFSDTPSTSTMPGYPGAPLASTGGQAVSSAGAALASVTMGTTSQSKPPSSGLPAAGGRPVSVANADAAFVDMAQSTITIARSIYGMLLDSFDADYDDGGDGSGVLMRELGPRRVKELTDLCILGNETTSKLKVALSRVRPPESRGALKFSTADARRLGNDAYAFVQTVIRFAKLVKAISLEHGFAPRIREGVGQLTIATRELAKTLHTATSFRPTVSSSSSSSSGSAGANAATAASVAASVTSGDLAVRGPMDPSFGPYDHLPAWLNSDVYSPRVTCTDDFRDPVGPASYCRQKPQEAVEREALPFSLPGTASTPKFAQRQLQPRANIFAQQLARSRTNSDDFSNPVEPVSSGPLWLPPETRSSTPPSLTESFWQAQMHPRSEQSWLEGEEVYCQRKNTSESDDLVHEDGSLDRYPEQWFDVDDRARVEAHESLKARELPTTSAHQAIMMQAGGQPCLMPMGEEDTESMLLWPQTPPPRTAPVQPAPLLRSTVLSPTQFDNGDWQTTIEGNISSAESLVTNERDKDSVVNPVDKVDVMPSKGFLESTIVPPKDQNLHPLHQNGNVSEGCEADGTECLAILQARPASI
ncbi:RAM signaling network component [Microbotryomycetes sp. JL201]|nr:RAM signaling network component [Microbotryomycetes sp. JL201]